MLRLVERERGVFTRGEEVVVLLEGVDVLDFGRAQMVHAGALPAWSIGTIGAVVREAGERRYAVFFRHGHRECVCIVGDAAIEGTA
jgi:hypothetical protein